MTTDTEVPEGEDLDATMGRVFDEMTDDDAAPDDEAAGTDNEIPSGDTPDDDEPASGDDAEAADDDADDDTPEGDEPAGLDAPEYWSAEAKAKFDALPDDAKAAVLEAHKSAQADYSQKTQELAEVRKRYEAIDGVTQKWGQYYQQLGVTPEQALDILSAAEYQLRNGTPEQKQIALQKLAKDYGIPYGATTVQDGEGDEYVDPQVSALQQTVKDLTTQLNEIRQGDQNRQQQAHRQLMEEQAGVVKTFAEAKDESGSLKHPHFDLVRDKMSELVKKDVVKTIDEAYQMALTLVPEAKAKIDAEAKAKASREAADKAKKAKKATVPSSKSASKGSIEPGETIDETLERSYDKAVGG
ncbi:MAG: hypothetical protein GC149_20370 [Gammaproteobacteria bacterium]|nr:hypothetical protein [Gammaproteobacteria bacterium]